MRKNVKKIEAGCVAVGSTLLVIIIAALFNAAKGDTLQVSDRVPESTFIDQDGTVYVAAFLKGMTENSVTVDVIEFITSDNEDRVRALNLNEGDMPDGYYIYNPDQDMTTWKLDSQTIYNFIDWNGIFTASDYPKEYTTLDMQEFQQYISTYEDSTPGMPFFFQVEDGIVKLVFEKFIA